MALVGAQAERIYVGKERSHHSMPQDDINALLVRLARAGRHVVRLKGGDPFVFGRGGEELQILAAEGVPFEVVPGITAACGVASYAGIPLTHRDYAQSCTFVTGHLKDGSCDLDWPALARPRQTVVIYMGLSGLANICTQLDRRTACRADWPAAVVAQGTLDVQRVVCATLATLADAVAREGLQSPCLTIVGEVVQLARRTRLVRRPGQPAHRASGNPFHPHRLNHEPNPKLPSPLATLVGAVASAPRRPMRAGRQAGRDVGALGRRPCARPGMPMPR